MFKYGRMATQLSAKVKLIIFFSIVNGFEPVEISSWQIRFDPLLAVWKTVINIFGRLNNLIRNLFVKTLTAV